jgi:hypothetical protein
MIQALLLPRFNSTLDLSTRVADLLHVYVVPTLTGILFLFKIASCVVIISIIRNKRKKEKYGYKFYFIKFNLIKFFKLINLN